ncbi:hypothetical protein RRG08_061048 [Elysia crispata]|uniref:Uncharacterized protein n=1 Tax=Elysia crispata TaxID=231223 RepID=A0AAE1AW29_9GAST|nr:hypothetical protein RRG08_061048 [Elysia crispata]
MVKCDGQPSRPSPLPELALDSVSWGGDTSWTSSHIVRSKKLLCNGSNMHLKFKNDMVM